MEILGKTIAPGESAELSMDVARLHTHTLVEIPVLVERAIQDGPTLLIIAGMHGDETNGIEIVRRVISKGINKPDRGTVISIPVFNVFGFINLSRKFPDGRDLNRVFPGSTKGSLASRHAWKFMKEIAPVIDCAVDFHTGGADRYNHPQIRCTFDDPETVALAKAFDAPLLIKSKIIAKSLRGALHKLKKPIVVFEGGKTLSFDEKVIRTGVKGVRNVMTHLGMKTGRQLNSTRTVVIENSSWIRSPHSGMFQPRIEDSVAVKKGHVLGYVTDPYGASEKKILAPFNGHLFAVNTAPVVNQGDALFHIGKDPNIQ